MSLSNPIQGIGGLGGGNIGLEMIAMIEMLMGLVMSELQQGQGQGGQANPGGYGQSGYGSPYGSFGSPYAGNSGGISQANPLLANGSAGSGSSQIGLPQDGSSFSPLAQSQQGGVSFQNGVPVVTSQDKSQAISDYLSNHSSGATGQDSQLLYNSLQNLSPGQLNLLFQEGTTYNFSSTDPQFQQDPNTIGYESDLNSNGQRTNPSIVINQNALSQYGPQAVEGDILHETTHALDFGVATAEGLPTELASNDNPAAYSALQNYDNLQGQGLVSWDNTVTDPTGKYPTTASDPQELIADAGKIYFSGGGAQLAAQDPQTYQALMDTLNAANNIGNQIVGL